MNKSTVFLAALALFAASCTKTEHVNNDALSSQRGIGFAAYSAKPTKAAQTDVTTANLDKFEVSAIGNGAVYFDNVSFSKGSSVWESDPVYFWPAYQLNFYAYNTPANGTFTPAIGKDSQTITFTPSETLAEQEDLVAAYAANQSEPSGATSLTFNHYLTQIVVKALNTNSTYNVEVAGAKIAHLDDKGVYTFSTNTMAVAPDAADQTYSSEYTANAKTLTASAQEVMTASTDNKWYLVPQTVTAWDKAETTNTSKGTYLALKVKITANSGALKIYPATGTDFAWMAVPVPASQEFKQGHKYTFLIKFFENKGAGNVDPEVPGDLNGDGVANDDNGKSIIGGAITFNATVSTWAPETEIVISL